MPVPAQLGCTNTLYVNTHTADAEGSRNYMPIHAWLVCALVGVVVCVVRGDAWPVLLSPCETCQHSDRTASVRVQECMPR